MLFLISALGNLFYEKTEMYCISATEEGAIEGTNINLSNLYRLGTAVFVRDKKKRRTFQCFDI